MTTVWVPEEPNQKQATAHSILQIAHSERQSKVHLPLAAAVEEAATCLLRGELVAFPTETVYGLGGLALSEDAVQAIFAAKRRPADNPLIAHVANRNQLEQLCARVPDLAEKLMDAFWPGPLSILLPALTGVPSVLTGGLPHVAVRMPSHPLALALIEAVGQPVAAPSANLSGRPSPTSALHVLEDFAGQIAGILDGGVCKVGIESTVVAIEGDAIQILRPGRIELDQLRAFSSTVSYDPHLFAVSGVDQPRAPGQKYTHYAPKGHVTLLAGEREIVHKRMVSLAAEAQLAGERVALLPLLPARALAEESQATQEEILWLPLGFYTEPQQIEHSLYAALRTCDEEGATQVLMECPPDDDAYVAVRNRMLKAAGGLCLNVC